MKCRFSNAFRVYLSSDTQNEQTMPLQDKHLVILWPLFPVLIAISLWFGVKAGGDNLLKNRTARSGIGSLERARTVEQAQWIIKSWDHRAPDSRTQSQLESQNHLAALLSNEGRLRTDIARRSLVFDLFFIVFYASALAAACLLAATEIAIRRHKERSPLVSLGIRLAYMQIITAGFDVLENVGLWRMLSGSTARFWPLLSYVCSIAKYSLVAVSLIYIMLAFIFWVIDLQQQPARNRSTVMANVVALFLLTR